VLILKYPAKIKYPQPKGSQAGNGPQTATNRKSSVPTQMVTEDYVRARAASPPLSQNQFQGQTQPTNRIVSSIPAISQVTESTQSVPQTGRSISPVQTAQSPSIQQIQQLERPPQRPSRDGDEVVGRSLPLSGHTTRGRALQPNSLQQNAELQPDSAGTAGLRAISPVPPALPYPSQPEVTKDVNSVPAQGQSQDLSSSLSQSTLPTTQSYQYDSPTPLQSIDPNVKSSKPKMADDHSHSQVWILAALASASSKGFLLPDGTSDITAKLDASQHGSAQQRQLLDALLAVKQELSIAKASFVFLFKNNLNLFPSDRHLWHHMPLRQMNV